jgi:putative MATE family efflux protein
MMTFNTVLSTIKQSLRGEPHDYTQGDIAVAVVLLAIPMVLELGLESVFAVVDMFFVSRLGENAIATVGLTESVVTIVYSIGIGISTGATAVVARRIGEKDPLAAAKAGGQSLILGLVASLALGLTGAFFAGDILRLMGGSLEVVQDGSVFARVMLGGSTAILMLFLINGIFRGAGDAAMAMRSLWIASGVNILLCPIFIHFFGLKGAAMATVLGRSSGVLYQSFHLFKGDGTLRMLARHFRPDFEVIRSILNIAWPASLQFMIGSGSWIILTRLVAETGGTAASAGYQIAFRNFVFFILPAWGLSNAAATLVGQNLGAKRVQRAEKSVYVTATYSAVLMAFVTAFFVCCSGSIVRIFSSDPEVISYGTRSLQIIGTGFIFYGIAMVMTAALNGAGDTRTPTWLNFFCFWVFQTPFAYVLAKGINLGAKGAIIALPASQILLAGLAYHFFKRGKWKAIEV